MYSTGICKPTHDFAVLIWFKVVMSKKERDKAELHLGVKKMNTYKFLGLLRENFLHNHLP